MREPPVPLRRTRGSPAAGPAAARGARAAASAEPSPGPTAAGAAPALSFERLSDAEHDQRRLERVAARLARAIEALERLSRDDA